MLRVVPIITLLAVGCLSEVEPLDDSGVEAGVLPATLPMMMRKELTSCGYPWPDPTIIVAEEDRHLTFYPDTSGSNFRVDVPAWLYGKVCGLLCEPAGGGSAYVDIWIDPGLPREGYDGEVVLHVYAAFDSTPENWWLQRCEFDPYMGEDSVIMVEAWRK